MLKYSVAFLSTIIAFITIFSGFRKEKSFVSDIISGHGYPIEIHENIRTKDGYLLTMHRIPRGRNDSDVRKRYPVLLMHGLFASAENFLYGGPEKSLPLLLADQGYDVWLGNSRGVSYSKEHIQYDTNEERYWDFSLHELAVYDVPAKVDYILNITGYNDIYYIGYSQGTTLFFILCAEHPEYNNKIKLSVSLAPTLYIYNISHPWMNLIGPFEKPLHALTSFLNIYELAPMKGFINSVGPGLCSFPVMDVLCSLGIFLTTGMNFEQLEWSSLPAIVGSFPESVSTKQFFHVCQLNHMAYFGNFDYSPERNNLIYGNSKPPLYNLQNVKAPVGLYYSQNDWFVSAQNAEKLANELSNVADVYKIPHKDFTHGDFLWAKDKVPLLYARVLEIMDTYRR